MYKILDGETLKVLYRAQSKEEIAEHTGLSISDVGRLAAHYNAHGRNRRNPPKRGYYIAGTADIRTTTIASMRNKERAAQMYGLGMSAKAVARVLGVSYSTAMQYRLEVTDDADETPRDAKQIKWNEEERAEFAAEWDTVTKRLMEAMTRRKGKKRRR